MGTKLGVIWVTCQMGAALFSYTELTASFSKGQRSSLKYHAVHLV